MCEEALGLPLVFPEQATFKEFAVRVGRSAKDVVREGRSMAFIPATRSGGTTSLDDALLVAVTEKRSPADIDRLADVLAEVAA